MAQGKTPLFKSIRKLIQGSARAIPRREFLKRSLYAGLLVSTPGLLLRSSGWNARSARGTRIAILGGGAAGLTAAYRLSQLGYACTVFEASARLGGRIQTENFPGTGMFVERGGELIDTHQTPLLQLCMELGVKLQRLRADDAGLAESYHFRGQHYTPAQTVEAFRPFAELLANDVHQLESEDGAFTDRAAALDRMSIAEYLSQRKFRDVDPWILDLIRVAYTCEYGLEVDRQSSLNLLTFIDSDTSEGLKIYGDSDESLRIEGGSTRLIDALTAALRRSGARLEPGQELTGIEESRNGMLLRFQGGHSEEFERVVCTIPFSVLREKVPSFLDLDLSAGKRTAIRELLYGTNTKVMYGFRERHWRTAKGGRAVGGTGELFTDLPLQNCWESSRSQKGTTGILTNYLGGTAGEARSVRLESIQRNIEDLNRIFPGTSENYLGRFVPHVWQTAPYHLGSYACPGVGQVLGVLPHTGTPELSGKLVFAGEHTSVDFAGFMCGAVESGERAAQEIAGRRVSAVSSDVLDRGLPLRSPYPMPLRV